MTTKLFSIKDTKANVFMSLVPSVNAETFKDDVLLLWTKGINNMITQFPSRYSLFELAEFDDTTGAIISHTPIYICSAMDIKANYIKSIEENQPAVEIPHFMKQADKSFTPSPSGNEEPSETEKELVGTYETTLSD